MKGYQDNLFNELIVDNFAGGGGASVGIELAVGRPVDIAINHDADAIAMHKVNHPYTEHYREDVFAIDPEKVTGGRPVGIAWFSPDCKHFSKAKGGKPVEKKIRGLSWVILKWAMSAVAPRCIFMENVEEIQTWGPLIEVNGKMHPDPVRAGETFNGFISMLTAGIDKSHPAFAEACDFLKIDPNGADGDRLAHGLGYRVEYKVLKACDYGAPTIRKRFYLVARNDGQQIVFPQPTHGERKGLKPYRTAAECIDWTIPCPSIFGRKKPLAVNTQRRIARGLDKFVIKNPKPFLLQMNFDNAPQDVEKPMSTQTAVNKHFVVNPTIVPIGYGERKGQAPRVNDGDEPLSTVVSSCKQNICIPRLEPYIMSNNTNNVPKGVAEPLPTVTTGNRNFLCVPSIVQYHTEQCDNEVRGQNICEPLKTVDTQPRYGVNACYLTKYFSGDRVNASAVDNPNPTVTAHDHSAVVAVHLSSRYGDGKDGRGSEADSPTHAVTGTNHEHLVAADIVHYYGGADHASKADKPLATVVTKPRHYLTESHLCVLRNNMDCKSLQEPMPTLTTSSGHMAQIVTYLQKIDTTQDLGHWNKVRKLLNEYAGYKIADDEILIIEIDGIPYFISDIGMRMLKARELKLAQGCPIDYIIDIEQVTGKKYSEAKQIARLGNMVCPPVATALIRANCPEMAYKKPLNTVKELNTAICG